MGEWQAHGEGRRIADNALDADFTAVLFDDHQSSMFRLDKIFQHRLIDKLDRQILKHKEVCEILERELAPVIGLQGPDEIEHLHKVWAGLLSPKPYPHPLAVWNVYTLDVAPDPEVNFIGPFELWDTTYLRTIDDSGYIDEMYGGAQAAANPAVTPVI
jgi:hypothetical protein